METVNGPMPEPRVRERVAFGTGGLPMLGAAIVLHLGAVALLLVGIAGLVTDGPGAGRIALVVAGGLVMVAGSILMGGLMMVAPGEARVVQFLGRYVGTVRLDGLRWVNPFTMRRRISTRIRNHETAVTKVNDADGNPIEIAAVVVWQVQDTARALFEVDDFVQFVAIQTETAVRHIATSYPYDAHGEASCRCGENADGDHREAVRGDRRPGRVGGRGGRSSRGSRTWRTRRRSPRRCCAASRPARSWRRASGSSRARWAWCSRRWTSWPSRRSWTSTRSARRRW